MHEDEETNLESSYRVTDDGAEFALLLSQVRSVLTGARCADKIDAELWLSTWLDTPNAALDDKRPRSLIKQIHVESRKK